MDHDTVSSANDRTVQSTTKGGHRGRPRNNRPTQSTTGSSHMTVRVGVIGLGIGRTHLVHLQSLRDVEIVAVADVVGQVATDLGAHYGAKPYTDALAMLNAEKLDAV